MKYAHCYTDYTLSYIDSNKRSLFWELKNIDKPPLRNECRVNLLATYFFFQILAHPVFKMWVIEKQNKVALWNKRHFEEEKMEIIQHV